MNVLPQIIAFLNSIKLFYFFFFWQFLTWYIYSNLVFLSKTNSIHFEKYRMEKELWFLTHMFQFTCQPIWFILHNCNLSPLTYSFFLKANLTVWYVGHIPFRDHELLVTLRFVDDIFCTNLIKSKKEWSRHIIMVQTLIPYFLCSSIKYIVN